MSIIKPPSYADINEICDRMDKAMLEGHRKSYEDIMRIARSTSQGERYVEELYREYKEKWLHMEQRQDAQRAERLQHQKDNPEE
jgi:hypothetical protein